MPKARHRLTWASTRAAPVNFLVTTEAPSTPQGLLSQMPPCSSELHPIPQLPCAQQSLEHREVPERLQPITCAAAPLLRQTGPALQHISLWEGRVAHRPVPVPWDSQLLTAQHTLSTFWWEKCILLLTLLGFQYLPQIKGKLTLEKCIHANCCFHNFAGTDTKYYCNNSYTVHNSLWQSFFKTSEMTEWMLSLKLKDFN